MSGLFQGTQILESNLFLVACALCASLAMCESLWVETKGWETVSAPKQQSNRRSKAELGYKDGRGLWQAADFLDTEVFIKAILTRVVRALLVGARSQTLGFRLLSMSLVAERHLQSLDIDSSG